MSMGIGLKVNSDPEVSSSPTTLSPKQTLYCGTYQQPRGEPAAEDKYLYAELVKLERRQERARRVNLASDADDAA